MVIELVISIFIKLDSFASQMSLDFFSHINVPLEIMSLSPWARILNRGQHLCWCGLRVVGNMAVVFKMRKTREISSMTQRRKHGFFSTWVRVWIQIYLEECVLSGFICLFVCLFLLLTLLFLSQKIILSDKLKNSIILRLQCLLHFEFTINRSYATTFFFGWTIVSSARVFKNSQLTLMDIISHELLQNSKDICDLIAIILLFLIFIFLIQRHFC